MLDTSQTKKQPVSYKRDTDGHLMCHKCSFRPKPTAAHPLGNPSTLHYHLKKQHDGDCSHVCKACGYAFLHKIALETHIASRHPEMNQTVEMFHCDVEGCTYESLTKGNLEIHKARKHYSDLVNRYLQVVETDSKKQCHCTCCNKDFNSSSAFNYHIVRFLESHKV